jgi:cytochrome c oxidase cbb3-type subunit 3
MLRASSDSLAVDPGLARMAGLLGGQTFSARCASCHGANAKGDTRSGVPNLTDSEWVYGEGKVSEIELLVRYGIRSHHSKAKNLAYMPAFGRADPYRVYKIDPLTPAEIRDVVEYLQFMEKKPAEQAAVGRGSVLFNAKGQCYDCHSADARGDNFIGAPDLTDSVHLVGDGSRQSLFDVIALGHEGICPAWIYELTAAAIREVSYYVYSLSHAKGSAKKAANAAG